MFNTVEEIDQYISNEKIRYLQYNRIDQIKSKYNALKSTIKNYEKDIVYTDNQAQIKNIIKLKKLNENDLVDLLNNYNWLDGDESIPLVENLTLTDDEESKFDIQRYDLIKELRSKLVREIIVEVNGNTFNGDEDSQLRMIRAIFNMSDEDKILWRLADNTDVLVTKGELSDAVKLAGLRQTKIWFI